MSFVTLPYPYPTLLEVLYDSHALARNPQTLQNTTLKMCVCTVWVAVSLRLP